MKTGVLFDLDGTLLDTLEDLMDAVNYALHQFGYPKRSLEEIRCFVGNGAANLMSKAVPHGADPQPVLDCFRAYYDAHCRNLYNDAGGGGGRSGAFFSGNQRQSALVQRISLSGVYEYDRHSLFADHFDELDRLLGLMHCDWINSSATPLHTPAKMSGVCSNAAP